MKLKCIYILLLVFNLFFSPLVEVNAQTQTLSWAREGFGTGVDAGNAITVDAAGNVYTTGYFEATCDFDPGAGVVNLTSNGWKDIFIMKSDASGNLLWVKSVGGAGDDEGSTIAVDASGNVYIGGSFSGTADLDPGVGTANLTQAVSSMGATFVLKLNSSGTFVWVKQFGGSAASVRLNKIILDGSGNPIIAGAFVYGPQDFDPNAGTANFTAIYQDAFILKLTSAGNYSWAKQIRGVNALDYTEAFDMEIDPSGNIIIVGNIHGTFDFDPGAGTVNLTSAGFGDSFVAKYTSAGIYIWAGITGGTTGSITVWNSELAIDAAGYLYITNYCNGGIVDFDITAGINNINITGSKTSIQKLNPNGNLVWVKILATSSWSVPICVGPTGIYLSSYFSGTVDFNPNAAVSNLTSTVSPFPSSNNDCYLLNLDTSGNFISALKYGARFNDYVEDLWIDGSGNIYATGYFYGEGDFDPGAGVSTLYSNGANDIFIHKLSSAGSYLWANGFGGATYHFVNAVSKNVGTYVSATGYFEGSSNSGNYAFAKGGVDIMVNKVTTAGNNFSILYNMGGPGDDAGSAIISDASDNVYVTGYFQQTADFAPDRFEPSFTMTSAGNKDIFIIKINSSGELVWAKRIGSASDEEPYAISLDRSGNLFVTGYYQGTVDFNPSVFLTNTLTSAGSLDAFVLKMDTAGNYLWAKSLGGTSADVGYDVAIDAGGNVIASGSFNSTADFNPSATVFNLTSVGSIDAFIVKLNSAGTFVWAKSFGSTANDYPKCIETDASNNIICAGTYGGATDFDPNAGVTSLTPPNVLGEIFLLQLTATGNFSFVKTMGGTGADKVKGLTIDAIGNIYTTGSFSTTADLNPSASTALNVTVNGSSDVFINCYRPATDASWTKTFGGTSFDEGTGIAVDATVNVYVIGNFANTVDFDPNAGVFNLTAMGSNDMFAIKLDQSTPLPVELLSFTATLIDNKKVDCKWSTATETNNNYFIIQRSKNAIDFENIGIANGAGTSNVINNYNFIDDDPYTGVSYYRLKQTDINGAYTFSQTVAVEINLVNEIKVYPTATTGNVFIDAGKGLNNAVIKITNLSGVLLKQIQGNASDNNSVITIDDLASGIYFITIEIDNKLHTFRVVKI